MDDTTDGKTDPRDIITISGRIENCESAKKALMVRLAIA